MSFIKKSVNLLLLNFFILISAEHPIVYFISPPRSLSVAFLRMIHARKDFTIFHEPSQWAWNKFNHYELTQSWFKKDIPQNFEQVKQEIFDAAQQTAVFVKEMSFAVEEFLLKDQELITKSNVYFVFLLRNPHDVTISFYRKTTKMFDGFSETIGYKACYNIFEHINHHAINKPIILFTEDLYSNPEATVKKFCDHIGIPFKEESMHWENLGTDFTGTEWHEIKHSQFTHHWHGEAIYSTKFGKPATYKIDAQGHPTFEEIQNIQDREHCIRAYLDNLPYYKLLKNAGTKMTEIKRPLVGVGVIIYRGNKILLGKRKNSHGTGHWSPPGGHLEFGESFDQCARREVQEETGLSLEQISVLAVTNDFFEESSKHYVTVLVAARYIDGEPQTLEPEKCEGWDWFEIDNLPTPLFLPLANALQQNKNLFLMSKDN